MLWLRSLLLSALFLVSGQAIAQPAAPLVRLGEPAYLFSLPAVNEDAALAVANRTQLGVGDFSGVRPTRPSEAVVLYFFDRAHVGDGLGSLQRLQRRFDGRGVQVLAICGDRGDLGGLSTWVDQQKLTFPVLRDSHGIVQARYGVSTMPLIMVVDRDGNLFAMGLGNDPEWESSLEGELGALLAKTAAPR
jgi:peroxiredoxin